MFQKTKATIIEKKEKDDNIDEKFKFLQQIKDLDKDINDYYRLLEENKETKKNQIQNNQEINLKENKLGKKTNKLKVKTKEKIISNKDEQNILKK